MSLRVVGAGLGRTGTQSLKVALEQLLGGRCYHMSELIERPADTAVWQSAVRGDQIDWESLLAEFEAAVDWPASAFWRELSAANPDAIVLLSTRESADAWWASMERTIVPTLSRPVPDDDPDWQRRRTMTLEMLSTRFSEGWSDRAAAVAAYGRHNDDVRGSVPPDRLVEWTPGDGWESICSALGLPIPADPFPHVNMSQQFRSSQGLQD